MTFPVNSISTITPACKAFALDLAQRMEVGKLVSFAGVFNCRHIAGQSSWSQHSWGNAVDLFADEAALQRIAKAVVYQGTHDTRRNGGKRPPIHYVIWAAGANGIWSPERGWHAYTGFHPPTHVHVDFLPERTGTPPCA